MTITPVSVVAEKIYAPRYKALGSSFPTIPISYQDRVVMTGGRRPFFDEENAIKSLNFGDTTNRLSSHRKDIGMAGKPLPRAF